MIKEITSEEYIEIFNKGSDIRLLIQTIFGSKVKMLDGFSDNFYIIKRFNKDNTVSIFKVVRSKMGKFMEFYRLKDEDYWFMEFNYLYNKRLSLFEKEMIKLGIL